MLGNSGRCMVVFFVLGLGFTGISFNVLLHKSQASNYGPKFNLGLRCDKSKTLVIYKALFCLVVFSVV